MFTWTDYSRQHAPLVDSWLDACGQQYTGCDEGWHSFYRYRAQKLMPGKDFRCNLVSDGGTPFAVIAYSIHRRIFTLMEILVAPQSRGAGYGTTVLQQWLKNGEHLIGRRIEKAEAVVFTENKPARRMFEKAGFHLTHAHPDGDVVYYRHNAEV